MTVNFKFRDEVMKLSVQDKPELSDPSEARLRSSLKSLRSYGRSSFAILSDDGGGYVQVAGGGVTCVVEMKADVSARLLRAYLRHAHKVFPDGTVLTSGAGSMSMRSDEWLNIDQATQIFLAFLKADEWPEFVEWRDMSSVFLDS
jgi:hypothetical protein